MDKSSPRTYINLEVSGKCNIQFVDPLVKQVEAWLSWVYYALTLLDTLFISFSNYVRNRFLLLTNTMHR